MNVEIFENSALLAAKAARLVVASARSAIEARGRFLFVLAGGSTPIAVYEQLGRAPMADEIDWGRIHLFWGDERCVPKDDERNNAGQALEALGEVVRAAKIHVIDTSPGPEAAAFAYETTIQRVLAGDAFDLVLLGIGSDGHTASLFPGSSALDVRGRTVVAVDAPSHISPKVPRVTLTLEVINKARHVLFLATGTSKSEVVRQILSEPRSTELPAARVQPIGRLGWWLDRDAGAGLKR